MRRFTAKIVFFEFVTAWRFAGVPTITVELFSPVKATTEGVVRDPSEFGITCGLPPSKKATHELVVPKSMPTYVELERMGCHKT